MTARIAAKVPKASASGLCTGKSPHPNLSLVRQQVLQHNAQHPPSRREVFLLLWTGLVAAGEQPDPKHH